MNLDRAITDSNALRQSGITTITRPNQREAAVKRIVRSQMYLAGNTLMMGIEPLTDDEFFAGGPNGVSPAWTVGHLACVLDLFTSFITGRTLVFSREAHTVFNPFEIKKKTMTKAESVD